MFLCPLVIDSNKRKSATEIDDVISRQKERGLQQYKETIMFFSGFGNNLFIDFIEEYYPLLILTKSSFFLKYVQMKQIFRNLVSVKLIPNLIDMRKQASIDYRLNITLKEYPDYRDYDIIESIFSEIENIDCYKEKLKMYLNLIDIDDFDLARTRTINFIQRNQIALNEQKEIHDFLSSLDLNIENYLSTVSYIASQVAISFRETFQEITLAQIVSTMEFEEYTAKHFEVLAYICNMRRAIKGRVPKVIL